MKIERHSNTLRAAVRAAALSIVGSGALMGGVLVSTPVTAAASIATKEVAFNIPAQSLESALLQLSKQADVQVMIGSTAIAGQKTEGVRGRLSVSEALSRLLSNTGLTFETVGNTVTVRAVTAAETNRVVFPLTAGMVLASAQDNEGDRARQDLATNADETLTEVVVTGTHIRGTESAGSKLLLITREEIDASGYSTLQDVIKTLPQNFAGGANEISSDPLVGNWNRGNAVNLRGLGSDSTLVLVNGQRQAMSGQQGGFVDIDSIPLAAIDRVEVLPDGASAIYGSDAVGGVVNILLKKKYSGAETRLRVGSARGGAGDRQISQLLGTAWQGGNILAGFQHNQRDRLSRRQRSYTSSLDLRRFGGTDFRQPASNPGNILNPFSGQPELAIPSGQNGTSLSSEDFSDTTELNYQNHTEEADLLPENRTDSAFLHLSQSIGNGLTLFADGRFSARETSVVSPGNTQVLFVPSSNPFYFNPFENESPDLVLVNYDFVEDLGLPRQEGSTDTYAVSAGAEWSLSKRWHAKFVTNHGMERLRFTAQIIDPNALDAALSNDDPATAFNPFGDGSNTNGSVLDAINGSQTERAVSRTSSVDFTADGPIFEMPGGQAKLALGAGFRNDRLRSTSSASFTSLDSVTSVARRIPAVFGELSLPLIGPENSLPGIRSFDVSLAARYERYSDFGATTNPKVGLTWHLADTVKVRSTWGTSFKAPRLADLYESSSAAGPNSNFAAFTFIPDPASPDGATPGLYIQGNNENLKEETARVWTAGMDFVSTWVDGLIMSATYYDIRYRDRIAIAGPSPSPFLILFQEEEWASSVIREPTQAQVAAVCNSGYFLGGTVEDCLSSAPGVIVDVRLSNLAKVKSRGVDLELTQLLDTTRGSISVGINANYTFEYMQAITAQSPMIDQANTVGNLPQFRTRGFASWNYRGFSLNTAVNFTNRYEDSLSATERQVGSMTTLDLQVGYRTENFPGWLGGMQIAVSAVNVLDRKPPFANVQNFGYDPSNSNILGRILSAQVTKLWGR